MHIKPERPKPHFLGVEFDSGTYEHIAREIDLLSRSDSFCFIVTPNVDHVLMLNPRDADAVSEQFQQAYAAASLTLCDSRILQRLARFHGIGLNLITGSDLTPYLFNNGYLSGRKVAIIGGDGQMLPELNKRYPKTEFVQHCPPMGVLQKPDAVQAIICFVEHERADYVLFTIGAPRSEIIAHLCKAAGQSIGVGLCIGASIEFLLGRKVRAPQVLQRLGFEWLYRLFKEPGRLWRRYLINGPRIFILAAPWQRK